MIELDYSQLISKLSNPLKTPYPVILPDFFVDHFVLVPTFDEFIENLRKLAQQGGGNLLGSEQFIRRGGNCVNTASALFALELDPRIIVTTDAYGKSLLEALAPLGINFDHVHTDGQLSSTVSIETELDGRKVNLMVCDSGSASDFKFSNLSSSDLQLIENSGLVALVNLNHNMHGADLARDLFKRVKETTDAITFMDIGDPSNNSELIEPLLKKAISGGNLDILGLNENEVGWLSWVLTGQEQWLNIVNSPKDWIIGAKLISKETGVRVILHTPHFASSIIGNDVVSVPTFSVETKIAMGSGDAFNAGLIYGVLLDLDYTEQLVLANAVAALYISSDDSIPPQRYAVMDFLKSNPLVSSSGKKLLME
ncbi:MAG: carbohydrate kinase family protein [Candidatus Thorarchaeota archaeon]